MKKLINISKEELYNKYIINNMSVQELALEFKISPASINRLLKKYEIKKDNIQRLKKISETKQNKTAEEKLEYSKHISEARKGKGTGKAPWNKGTHGLQIAWNKGLHIPGKPRTSESLEKARQTCLEKYGVEWACQRQEARLKGQNSQTNLEFEHLLKTNNIEYSREFPINNYSYDFKINNYLVELDPYATHNSTWGIRDNAPKDKDYHKIKSDIAHAKGYSCIHIFDWDDKNKIINLLTRKETIGARYCQIEEITKQEAIYFINSWHIQGYVKDQIRIALKYDNKIVSIMTFGKPRYNKNYEYELIRYCNNDIAIVGGAEKLLKYFIEKYKPKNIISYCDLSKFSGKIYTKLGFNRVGSTKPSKHWYNPKLKKHITDNLLRQHGFDQLFSTNLGKTKTNSELMLEHGFVEIYDCGQATYVWNNK